MPSKHPAIHAASAACQGVLVMGDISLRVLSIHSIMRRVYLPVFVEGANVSMGDMHFSQGDGEVSTSCSL
jgi:hypothetical protein